MAPKLIFGTATFGMEPGSLTDAPSVGELLTTLKSIGIDRLDTAPRYPPFHPGRSEELIGEVADLSGEFVVDTKLFTDTATDGSGDLNKESMERSIEQSLRRLQRRSVRIIRVPLK